MFPIGRRATQAMLSGLSSPDSTATTAACALAPLAAATLRLSSSTSSSSVSFCDFPGPLAAVAPLLPCFRYNFKAAHWLLKTYFQKSFAYFWSTPSQPKLSSHEIGFSRPEIPLSETYVHCPFLGRKLQNYVVWMAQFYWWAGGLAGRGLGFTSTICLNEHAEDSASVK